MEDAIRMGQYKVEGTRSMKPILKSQPTVKEIWEGLSN